MQTTYRATGVVLGRLWGGGEGMYPSRPVQADTLEQLRAEAQKALEDGSLDGGMGFERLIGALLDVEATITKTIDGKEYYRNEYHEMELGDLTDEQLEFLREATF